MQAQAAHLWRALRVAGLCSTTDDSIALRAESDAFIRDVFGKTDSDDANALESQIVHDASTLVHSA